MNVSKKITAVFFTTLFALMFAFMPNQSQAALADQTDELSYTESVVKIKIVIIIIIKKKKKKGLVEVAGMKLASKNSRLASNEVLAEAYVEDGKFFIMPLRGEESKSQFLLPSSFKVSKEVSLKLGEKSSFGLKSGSIDFSRRKMGNFEIQ